jgi:hypothetical protein
VLSNQGKIANFFPFDIGSQYPSRWQIELSPGRNVATLPVSHNSQLLVNFLIYSWEGIIEELLV